MNKSIYKIIFLFCAAFAAGSLLGKGASIQKKKNIPVSSSASTSWGLSFQEEGKRPVGNATIEELARYNACYAQDTQ